MPAIEVGTQNVPFNPQSFVGSDAYKFLQGEGDQAILRNRAAMGGLLNGGTLKALQERGMGLASTFWGQQLGHDREMAGINAGIMGGNANRTLSGLTSLGSLLMPSAGGLSGAYGNYGMAGAGGTIGGASAMNTAMGNAGSSLGAFLAQRRQQPGPVPSTALPMAPSYNPALFGGSMNPDQLSYGVQPMPR